MEHKRISRVLLAAGTAAAFAAAIVLIRIVPYEVLTYLDISVFRKVLCLALDAAVLFFGFGALVKYARICIKIGRNRSFCRENAADMGGIAKYLFCCGGCCIGIALPVWSAASFWPEVLAALVCWGLGVIAYALSRLLDHAVSLQEENDLTV